MKTTKKDITIICDNGGGITLQVGDYQHTYDDAKHCANDIREILAGESTYDWDGNEAEYWINPTAEQISNGGYRVFDLDGIISVDPESIGWHNIRELHNAMVVLTGLNCLAGQADLFDGLDGSNK